MIQWAVVGERCSGSENAPSHEKTAAGMESVSRCLLRTGEVGGGGSFTRVGTKVIA